MEMFTAAQAQQLINLARNSIQAHFDETSLDLSPYKQVFGRKQGCFTTIYLDDKLKGCIGFPFPNTPLYKAVHETAISAAFHDPRFSPLRMEELSTAVLELNILSPLELIEVATPSEYPAQVEVGIHGLYVINAYNRRGLLLPEVAARNHWDAKQFLNQTCIKANLPKSSWIQDPDMKIYRFSSLIIKELEPLGEIEIS